jgi:hypothetical protein
VNVFLANDKPAPASIEFGGIPNPSRLFAIVVVNGHRSAHRKLSRMSERSATDPYVNIALLRAFEDVFSDRSTNWHLVTLALTLGISVQLSGDAENKCQRVRKWVRIIVRWR